MLSPEKVWQLAAYGINRLLVLLLLATPLLGPRRKQPAPPFWIFAIRCVLGIAIPVGFAELGKAFSIWPGHPEFPSGHETFASAAATCLVIYHRDWLWVAVPLVILMGVALIAAQLHTPVEVIGGLLLGPPLAWLCQTTKRDAGLKP